MNICFCWLANSGVSKNRSSCESVAYEFFLTSPARLVRRTLLACEIGSKWSYICWICSKFLVAFWCRSHVAFSPGVSLECNHINSTAMFSLIKIFFKINVFTNLLSNYFLELDLNKIYIKIVLCH